MAKSAWHLHVAAFRAAQKGMDPKKVFGEAAKTFKKQSGGEAMGGTLAPRSISGIKGDSGTGLQLKANLYSGGGSKRRGSKRRGGFQASRQIQASPLAK